MGDFLYLGVDFVEGFRLPFSLRGSLASCRNEESYRTRAKEPGAGHHFFLPELKKVA
jgi:hypothetical protein